MYKRDRMIRQSGCHNQTKGEWSATLRGSGSGTHTSSIVCSEILGRTKVAALEVDGDNAVDEDCKAEPLFVRTEVQFTI